MNIYIGEPVVISDMQGPCPDGFHVPSKSEWDSLISAGVTLGAWTSSGGEYVSSLLNIPYSGRRDRTTSNVDNQGTRGEYWCCNATSSPKFVTIYTGYISTNGNMFSTAGFCIRPFKNSSLTPDSSWTEVYTNGIYHNSILGLISVKNGNDWITISDKNLGATTVYNNGDTLSESNCGNYYQWGNNNGFPWTGNVTTSGTQVNASTYGPGNYYSSSTFITRSSSPYNWDSSDNRNLRGGVSQGTSTKSVEVKNIYIGEYVPNFATRGPCPEGFHVPLSSEWDSVYNAGLTLGAWTSNGYVNCQTYLKLPSCGYREGASGGVADTSCFFWTSEIYNAYNAKGYMIGTSRIGSGQRGKSYGTPIRPFKNTPVTPDSNWTELYTNGIYHNSTLGLISIKNGSDWITISDKNLGATTVRNYGNNNTAANCGYFYQRGNNHGFPFTGTVTTSSTQVNASTYGPGNYYDSSTFIISGSYYWDTSYNKNLRGGVDGNVPV